MSWKRQVLVVANVTATSDGLVAALRDRAARESVEFTLVVPTPPLHGGRTAAIQQVDQAVALLRTFDLEVHGSVGDADPMVAVAEAWDPRRYDEIILSTLPAGVSKWLHADLPRRVENHTGARVTHVIALPPKIAPKTVQVRKHEKLGVMSPLSVLMWGGPPKDRSGP